MKRIMQGWRRWLAAWVLVGVVVAAAGAKHAAARRGDNEVHPTVEYTFGERIRFVARFSGERALQQVTLFYRPGGSWQGTLHAAMTLAPDGTATFVHDLKKSPLPPFSTIFYWFRVRRSDGTAYTTPSFSFVLTDNRFAWQHLSEGPFEVWWHEGDDVLAQQVVDAAAAGLARAENLWLAPAPEHVRIYVYADPRVLQQTLGAKRWVAGHASPAYGALFLALPPGPLQESETRRLVPHELAHDLLYRQVGDAGYHNLPVWLNEGLASLTELRPNPDYAVALKRAAAQDRLLPLASLCDTFPNDASDALLAYAEATSFTAFLLHRYGRNALHTLVAAYGQGVDCESGVQHVLGRSLWRLNRDWEAATFHRGWWYPIWEKARPWVGVFAVLLASLFLSAWLARRPTPSPDTP